jgi:SAM-dependent methyltransferase
MGVADLTVAAMIREAVRKPFQGTAYTFGRQTVNIAPEQVLPLFRHLGCEPAITEFHIDRATRYAQRNEGENCIRDIDFLTALGLSNVKAIDISDFEGAEIIIDLNRPLPSELETSCDLVLDGSTLDNIFDPVTALKSIGRMLRPGGRAFIHNLGNASYLFPGIPYTVFNPVWFFDYFVWNNFDYCQAYCFVYPTGKRVATFALSLERAARLQGSGFVRQIDTPYCMSILIYAEKGADSTWDRMPIQHAYRPNEDWQRYTEIVSRYVAQQRDLLVVTEPSEDDIVTPPGWVRATSLSALRA